MSSDDDSEVASENEEELEEAALEEEQIDVDDLFQYSLEEPILIEMSSDDDSEVASENEEELEEATLDEEKFDVDQSEVSSEHSLENVNDPPKYSTEDPCWVEVSSDDDSEVASENEKELEEATLDEEQIDGVQSEG